MAKIVKKKDFTNKFFVLKVILNLGAIIRRI